MVGSMSKSYIYKYVYYICVPAHTAVWFSYILKFFSALSRLHIVHTTSVVHYNPRYTTCNANFLYDLNLEEIKKEMTWHGQTENTMTRKMQKYIEKRKEKYMTEIALIIVIIVVVAGIHQQFI